MRFLSNIGIGILSLPCSLMFALMVAVQGLAMAFDRLGTLFLIAGLKTQTRLTAKMIGSMFKGE